MAEGVKILSPLDLPPTERPKDFRLISFVSKLKPTEMSTEVEVKLTVHFGKVPPNEFTGKTYHTHSKEELAKREAISFMQAAQKVWTAYHLSSDKDKVKFVQDFLLRKWEDLNGEKLSGKRLILNNNKNGDSVPKNVKHHSKT